MNVTSPVVREALFRDMHRIHYACVEFRMRVLGHRIRSFGFEETINRLSPREQIALSCWMPRHARVVLCIAAYNNGGGAIREFLRVNWSEQFVMEPARG